MSPRQRPFRFLGLVVAATAVLALPFTLTMGYSSLAKRGIATSLSFPEAGDTRLFLAVVSVVTLAILATPHRSEAISRPAKRFGAVMLVGLSAFGAGNALSFLFRGGPSVSAWGFPFKVGSVGSSAPYVVNASSMDYTALWMDVAVAVIASASVGLAQLRVVRHTSRLKRAVAIFSVALVAYLGTFSFYWLTSKTMTGVREGKRLCQVEVHQCDVMYLTQPIWEPAFWFVEHICGYRYIGYVAAMEDSTFLFEK